MTAKELFVKYHWRQTLFLGGLAVFCVAFQVLIEEMNNRTVVAGLVKGETTGEVTVEKAANQFLAYQEKVKTSVVNYLKERAKYDAPHEAWLFLINNTRFELLKLNVPAAYRELHLALITTLDKEKAALAAGKEDDLKAVNELWEKILEQYFWLN